MDYAPESGLLFKDAAETAAQVVEEIKENEDYDIIICLSHCGTIENSTDKLEAVSYTHLDVYKRQILCTGNTFRREIPMAAEGMKGMETVRKAHGRLPKAQTRTGAAAPWTILRTETQK